MKRILIVCCIIPLVAFVEAPKNKYFEISKNLEIFTNLYKQLNTDYVDELDPGGLMRVSIDAMLESLDPYTNYFSESQIESFRFQSEGQSNGLGARTKSIDDYVTITDMAEGSPADNAGLKIGDQIISVDGQDVIGMSNNDVQKFLQGAEGTSFNISILRPGEKEKSYVVQRGQSSSKNVPYSGFVHDDIGYLILTTFTQNAGQNLKKAINALRADNPDMKGIVFDLRNNGGGLLLEAINVSNLFIPKGLEVVTTRGKVKERSRTYKTPGNALDVDIPLAILTNKSSASASEIVAGVIQDYDRGLIIGQRSYGKGLVQVTKDIGYNSTLKVTTSKYYIPSGRCIQSIEYSGGEPKDVPDSLRTSFSTKKGRPVLDGGGITPDIRMDEPIHSEIVRQLRESNILFKFINEWTLRNPDIPGYQEFRFTDFDDFVNFVQKSDFEYKSNAQQDNINLLESIREDQYSESLISKTESLLQDLISADNQALINQKEEIISLLEKDIVKRYYPEKDKILFDLQNDPEIQIAIDVLSDTNKYYSLLE